MSAAPGDDGNNNNNNNKNKSDDEDAVLLLSCASFTYDEGTRNALLVKTTTRRRRGRRRLEGQRREYLFNCPESFARLSVETYSRPRGGFSAIFAFDDVCESLAGACSLILRLSADGHEKVAVVGKRGVEKVVERLEKILLRGIRARRAVSRPHHHNAVVSILPFFSRARIFVFLLSLF